MNWCDHFNQVFFETWQKAGLPNHPDFLNQYIDVREHGDFSNEWIQNLPDISPGINRSQLRSVYGFGVTIGKIFADMFSLNAEEAKKTSDWCGRFNLGISLFDYICDEFDGVSSVSSLEVFKLFSNSDHSVNRTLTPAEELLTDLAGSVLNDVKKLSANKEEEAPKVYQLFKAMKSMFEAENFISKECLAAAADLKKIEKALCYKSAGPFRVMAEFPVLAANTNNNVNIKNAASIGKSLGYCYWVIDDAKDVWDDLKSQKWNLFLVLAAAEEPRLFAAGIDADMESRLVKIWEQSDHVEKKSRQIIKRLGNAVKELQLPEKIKQNTLGLVWASLWQWSKY